MRSQAGAGRARPALIGNGHCGGGSSNSYGSSTSCSPPRLASGALVGDDDIALKPYQEWPEAMVRSLEYMGVWVLDTLSEVPAAMEKVRVLGAR